MRVLVTTQPGSGHWRPLAPLAHVLAANGHEVAFATTPLVCADLATYGFRCFPVGADDWLSDARARSGDAPEAPAQAAAVWVELFAGSRAANTLPELLDVCRAWRPDLLVRESTEFAGCVAAEHMGIPHVAVQVGAWRPALHRLVGPALDRLRARVGLPPDPAQHMLHRHLLLSLVPPSFDDPEKLLPPTARQMRHVPFDCRAAEQSPTLIWAAGSVARPTIYATLGTAYNRAPGVFQAILDALRDEPAALIVALGSGLNPASFGDQPPHIRLEPYVPQSLNFPRCDLVVCHGGFGTMMTALSFGLPMVMLPIAADQPDNARRCAALGVAQVVAPEDRTPRAIRAAVREVLTTPSYRLTAQRLRDEIAAMPGPDQAAIWLAALTAERRPGSSKKMGRR